ncbi:dihydroorotase [Glaciibacter superstes]|uniref:dihydroorotase n=1 Tax=Glaciibacter superstes TaxID=501023 RepID=UPI0003B6A609|nr:dihydroorotase family protein [Glaciibacter superstes]
MTQFDLALRGGRTMLPGVGLTRADIYVTDGAIAAIATADSRMEAIESVDVTGRWILPGVIDAHVHLGQDISAPKNAADAEKESASAAAGGVTTMLAYLMSPKPYGDVFPDAKETMLAHSHTNFGFHFCVVTPEQVEAISSYAEDLGVSSFKVFTNFRGDEGAYLGLPGNDDAFLFDALQAAADSGTMIAQHAENIELVWRLRQKTTQSPDAGLPAWNDIRPTYVEAEAEGRVGYLASVTGASAYAVHVTSAESLAAIQRQQAAYGNLFIETCPHYLTLNAESPIGSRGKVNPPLRTSSDNEALWEAIRENQIDVLGSDHVPRHFSAKDKDIWSASAGFPGTGTLFPLFLSEAIRRGISLETVVNMTSTRPAQIFGMGARKGRIELGFDADLTIVDPTTPFEITAATQHSGAEYSVWEGWSSDVSIEHTIVKGRFALRNGELTDTTGEYIPRRFSGRRALTELAGR